MQSIFFHLAGISVTVSIVVVILLLFSAFLNERYTVKWRYYLWLILAVRLILPVDFGLSSPPVELNLPDHELFYSMDQERLAKLAPEKPDEAVFDSAAASEQRIAYQKSMNTYNEDMLTAKRASGKSVKAGQIAAGIYFAGAAVFLIWQFSLYLIFRESTRRWYREVSNPMLLEAVERLKAELGIKRPLDIKICRKILSPMIAGLFRPVLLLPHEGYQTIDLEVILKHELVHLKRKDLWFKLLLICVNGLHWFNPVIYRMVREANKDIEISCDEEVLKGADMALRKRYSERILELMQGNRQHEAPVSTSFHGGRGMMKSRMKNIFDDRVKKKGVISFLMIFALVLVFSACRLDVGQNEWKIPIKRATIDVYGFDEKGHRNSEIKDTSVGLSYDLNGDGKDDTAFSLLVKNKGGNCYLEYKGEDGKAVETQVFKGVDPGVEYGIQAANLEDLNSVSLLISINYHGMPFGSGYWELYSWRNGTFQQVELKPVEENLKMNIMTAEQIKNNTLGADGYAYLYDTAKYPLDYPALALYFKDNMKNDGKPRGVTYAPMSEYDVEGFKTWGQDAAGKIMTGMNFTEGSDIEGWKDPSKAALVTEETVYITLPNITASVERYYQYQNGKWTPADGYIK